jgi:hypothetical protein
MEALSGPVDKETAGAPRPTFVAWKRTSSPCYSYPSCGGSDTGCRPGSIDESRLVSKLPLTSVESLSSNGAAIGLFGGLPRALASGAVFSLPPVPVRRSAEIVGALPRRAR